MDFRSRIERRSRPVVLIGLARPISPTSSLARADVELSLRSHYVMRRTHDLDAKALDAKTRSYSERVTGVLENDTDKQV